MTSDFWHWSLGKNTEHCVFVSVSLSVTVRSSTVLKRVKYNVRGFDSERTFLQIFPKEVYKSAGSASHYR